MGKSSQNLATKLASLHASTPQAKEIDEEEEQKLDAIARSMGIVQEREASKRERNELLTAFWRASGPAKVIVLSY